MAGYSPAIAIFYGYDTKHLVLDIIQVFIVQRGQIYRHADAFTNYHNRLDRKFANHTQGKLTVDAIGHISTSGRSAFLIPTRRGLFRL